MVVSSKMADPSSAAPAPTPQTDQLEGIVRFWEKAQPHLARIKPMITRLLPIIATAGKQTKNVVERYVVPHYTDDVGRIMWNVILVFFGGQFAMTIMALQAFQMTGSSLIQTSLQQLREQYVQSMARFQNDPDAREIFDSNNDGVITLDEVSQAVISSYSGETDSIRTKSKKIVSICLRCVDPSKINAAFQGFLMGLLAIIATLKSTLGKVLSVGAKIGEHLGAFLKSKTQKALYERYPEHKDWVDMGLRSGSTLLGVIASFMLMKVMNAFNCALQGAQSLSAVVLDVAHKRGRLLNVRPNDTSVQALTMGIVFVGVMTQFKSGFKLPWYLKLALFPVVISENVLGALAVA